jgi:hypothetical protein
MSVSGDEEEGNVSKGAKATDKQASDLERYQE